MKDSDGSFWAQVFKSEFVAEIYNSMVFFESLLAFQVTIVAQLRLTEDITHLKLQKLSHFHSHSHLLCCGVGEALEQEQESHMMRS